MRRMSAFDRTTKYLYQSQPGEIACGARNTTGRRYHEYDGRDADLKLNRPGLVHDIGDRQAYE